ncbi:M48 family metallopeptidase [Chloroflexota bacterium]
MPSIELEGINIYYTVIRHPRRRHVHLQVRPGLAILRIPQRFASRHVPEILRQRAGWIRQRLALLEEAVAATRRQYVTGERFPYLGKTYALKVIYGEDTTNPFVKLRRGVFWAVTASPTADGGGQCTVRDAILRWYHGRAKEYLPERVEKLSENIGMRPARVAVRNQTTRWGSCSSSGSVNLNWRLVLSPTHIVDYVVAHELCHLKVANHSPQFWRLLAEVDTHYAHHRRWLRANSFRLGLWLHDPRPT